MQNTENREKALIYALMMSSPEASSMGFGQEEIDNILHEIDGTKDFKKICGNTAFAISLANAEAAANSHGRLLFQFLGGNTANTLPFPLGNTISGGQHTRGKAPDIQEFLALPHGA